MYDPSSEIFFCICGKRINQPGTCGASECILEYEVFKGKIEEFFLLMEEKGFWEGFKVFKKMNINLQIGIMFELEDELLLIFLQCLGQERVLELLESKNQAMRFRLLELLEPLLEKEIYQEFKQQSDLEKEDIKELLLYTVNIILESVQKDS